MTTNFKDANSPSSRVITICSLKHSDVWKLTSRLLLENLVATEYFLYVPESEIGDFAEITPSEFTLVAQETLGVDYREKLHLAISDAGNSSRYGWYLQQFFKIEALLKCDRELGIIWDADCVPLQPIPILNKQNKIVYMDISNEFNPPYFEAIHRLLGMERIQKQCFVIPAFPFWSKWSQEFVDAFAKKSPGLTWWEAIILKTDLSLTSGFSETETLGTWVANAHPDSWVSEAGLWERRGQRRFGYARSFSVEKLKRKTRRTGLQIVSFENWDTRGIEMIKYKIKSKFWWI